MRKERNLVLLSIKSQKLNVYIQFLAFCVLFVLTACEVSKKEIESMKPFEGPTMKTFELVTNYSDSGMVKIRVSAPLQLEYETGNQEFPDGIQVDFFNEKEENYSRLTAKEAFYDKTKNEYTAQRDVVVENVKNQEILKTEELNWTPSKREIYTDKFVVITTPTEILKGHGLVAAQDFTAYEIKKPTGVFSVPKQ